MSRIPGVDNLIINLSKTFLLTPDQRSVLQKGLTFIPTPTDFKTKKIELVSDLQAYHRRLQLETHFEGKKLRREKLPFTGPSEWTPSLATLPNNIRQIVTADCYAVRHLNWGQNGRHNLTRAESRALKELSQNTDIVIKQADKGNAVVILDKEQYLWEGHRQLGDGEYYRPLDRPIFAETAREVRDILEEMCQKKIINWKQRDFLLGDGNPRPRRFYLLPKIHKSPHTWSKPYEIPPGRPIVSDCNSESYFTARYVEHFLNPLAQKHDSYIKDTYDFLEKIGRLQIPQDAFLFTIDVDSLYTNIETDVGVEAVKECFKKHPDPKRPDNYIIKLLKINLTKNDFQFNSKFYLQTKGTAMGKAFAPSYANIFMARWEESALASHPLKPFSYFRFLDDIWGVWTHSEDAFSTFIQHLNNHQKSIKIKYTLDPKEVNFLDVTTFKGTRFSETGRLDFRVHFKETDTHSLLHKTSFHPKHTFQGIVKSQLLRFHRICSEPSSFLRATKTLFSALRHRGYSRTFLRKILRTFREPKRPKPGETAPKDKLIPLVTHFSEQSVQLNLAVKANFSKFLTGSNFLQKHKPIAAFRRNKNLKDVLVHSKLQTAPNYSKSSTIKYFAPQKVIKSRSTGRIFHLSHVLNGRVSNCVYLIFCTRCRRQYVGQTKNELQYRIYQHVYNITHKIEKRRHLVLHFLSHGLTSLRFSGLQTCAFWTLSDRLRAEKLWMKRLDTMFPKGLNEM